MTMLPPWCEALSVMEETLAGARHVSIVLADLAGYTSFTERNAADEVAAMLAGSRKVRAAILVTPFDSFAALAAHHYPYFPVRLLLRHPLHAHVGAS